MIPAWVSKYVGLQFKARGRGPTEFDCWGLVRFILKDRFNLDAPDFSEYYSVTTDREGIPQAFGTGTKTWVRVDEGEVGDVVIITIGGKPMHCGLVVDRDCMIHIRPNVGSCIENYGRPQWARRIEGFYRHPSRCN